MKNQIFLALDLDDEKKVISLAEATLPYVGGFKIGPRLVYRYGQDIVKKLSQMAPVFVDNKYYDIPTVMDAAVRTTFEAGASFCTVHASAGSEALKLLATTQAELSQSRPFKILAVTVLTSFSDSSVPNHWKSSRLQHWVSDLAELAHSCGLDGLVSSADELSVLRAQFPQSFLLVPGIRFSDDAADDQKRIMDPARAISLGASALVVGRPIYKSADPAAAAKKFALALR